MNEEKEKQTEIAIFGERERTSIYCHKTGN